MDSLKNLHEQNFLVSFFYYVLLHTIIVMPAMVFKYILHWAFSEVKTLFSHYMCVSVDDAGIRSRSLIIRVLFDVLTCLISISFLSVLYTIHLTPAATASHSSEHVQPHII